MNVDETSTVVVGEFAQALARWRKAADISLREQSRQIGCSPSLLVLIAQGERRPTTDFMAAAIAKAPDPWDSVLREARHADRETADRVAARAIA